VIAAVLVVICTACAERQEVSYADLAEAERVVAIQRGTKGAGLNTRLPRWSGRLLLALVVVVCSPLLLLLLFAYALYAVLLHVVLWLLWSTAGKRVLFVYSNSPVWQPYIEANILPRLPHGSVILNWSERQRWRWWSLSAAVFYFFGGSREFNPLAVVVRPFRWGRTFRFWKAFGEAKHGNQQPLRAIEAELFESLGLPRRGADHLIE
jgi:hypothetical protein